MTSHSIKILLALTFVACSQTQVAPGDDLLTSMGELTAKLPMPMPEWKQIEIPEEIRLPPRQSPKPGWICALPSWPGYFLALGYASPHIYHKETLDQACRIGAHRLARSLTSHVRTQSFTMAWNEWTLGHYEYEIDVPESQERVVEQASDVLDIWINPRNGKGYCLVGLAQAHSKGLRNPVRGVDMEKACVEVPRWRDHPPKPDPKYIYATGTSPNWADTTLAWLEAEKDAIGELSKIVKSKVRGVIYTLRHATDVSGDIDSIGQISTDANLYGAQVIAWWTDPKTGERYTLARLPLSHVRIALVLRAAPEARKTAVTTAKKENLLQKAEKHHKKMENVLESIDW
jgi:hypothetical protein